MRKIRVANDLSANRSGSERSINRTNSFFFFFFFFFFFSVAVAVVDLPPVCVRVSFNIFVQEF